MLKEAFRKWELSLFYALAPESTPLNLAGFKLDSVLYATEEKRNNMIGGLSVFESSIEALFLMNYCSSSSFPFGSLILPKAIVLVSSRRKKEYRISARSTLSDRGSVVLDKEFEFKPSFDEYLKALESVKMDRDKNDGGLPSSTSSRKKRAVKRIVQEEEKDNGGLDSVGESSAKGGYMKKSAFAGGDLKGGRFHEETTVEEVKMKRNKVSNFKGNRNDGNENTFLDLERAAFKSLESETVIEKPRVTKVDMEDRIQKLAKCLNGADIGMPEWQFSKMMRSAQIRFSDYSILRVVRILGKLGNWKRVLQVIEWMQSHERFKSHKTRFIYTAALDALGKARRPVEALNIFHAMQGQMASYPDMMAYHSIAVTLGQAGHMKELFDVIDTMRAPPKKKLKTPFLQKWDPRLEPDVTVYNAVLNACVQRKKWEGAFWVLQQLNQKDQQPSSTTYGLIMEVMLACGKYNLVHDLFKKVQKLYIPNALIYKVLVNTLWKEGKSNEAMMAVEEMERRGIVGNAALYYDLARCLCSAGRCHEALKQVNKICKVANKPLVVTYTGLIQACLDAGDIESGAYIFNHMQKFCSPNLVTCNIMLKGFLDHRMYEEAKKLFVKLLENGKFIAREEDYKVRVIPDIYSFNTMLDACAMEKKWDDLEFVYAQMLKYGHHFNAKRHLRLILDAHRAGKENILETTWKHLLETERFPPRSLVIEMLCIKLENGESAAGLSCFMDLPSPDPQAFSRKFWSNFLIENGYRFNKVTLQELVHMGSTLLSSNQNVAAKYLIESCKEFLPIQRESRDLCQIEDGEDCQMSLPQYAATQVQNCYTFDRVTEGRTN